MHTLQQIQVCSNTFQSMIPTGFPAEASAFLSLLPYLILLRCFFDALFHVAC